MTQCLAPGCLETKTIDSHIIPRSFAKRAKESNPHENNIGVRPQGITEKFQHGFFVKDILCAKHDGQLGDLDSAFIQLVRGWRRKCVNRGTSWELPADDADTMLLFALSILWRASVSKSQFAEVTIAPHEDRARDILFSGASFDTLPAYRLFVDRIKNELNGNKEVLDEGFYSYPFGGTVKGYNGWYFHVGGFRFRAILDDRASGFSPTADEVRGGSPVQGKYVVLDKLIEWPGIARLMADAETAALRKRRN